ncbi:MAG: alpha/beta fold hydrolase [Candidatus Omnitrophica bacterium]|nr:alpha/beta fold hydrolase [Candidatus Omnitrophota bacterium]
MEVKIGQFNTEDCQSLYYNYWPAQSTAAPCAVYLHGLESHSSWFANLAEFLKSKNINIYASDRRGSGINKSGSRNFYSKYLLSDVKLFLDLVKKDHPQSKIFLIGLCLGGKIAASFLSLYPDSVDGLILVSPSIKSKLRFPLSDKLSILFKHNRLLKIPIKDSMFTSNKKYLNYIEKDTLRLKSIPAQALLEIANMDRFLKRASSIIRVPVLLMLAGIDDIIDTGSVKRWYEKLPARDKTLKVYKDYHHILTFEENAVEVMQDIADWIKARADA